MSIFGFFMVEYALRRSKDHPFRKESPVSSQRAPFVFDRNMKRLVGGICLSTILVYIRYADLGPSCCS